MLNTHFFANAKMVRAFKLIDTNCRLPMNKQQLASKIWDSANKMRSKIEANEYKDYILGFMFYKFLSDKELSFLEANDFAQSDIEALTEEDAETVEFIKNGIGYFIAYDELFSTWLNKGLDFTVADVRDALSAFSRHIHSSHKKVFDGIFKTLETGLSKLGDNSNSQTKAISDLLQLIKVKRWSHLFEQLKAYL